LWSLTASQRINKKVGDIKTLCVCPGDEGHRAVPANELPHRARSALRASVGAGVVLELLKMKGAPVMSKKGAQLLDEALSLPPAERAELADRLLTSLEASPDHRIDELWAQEAEDRVDAFGRGEIKTVSARDAIDAPRDVKR
jgi:putative addiction module component (TIGR02574 family)